MNSEKQKYSAWSVQLCTIYIFSWMSARTSEHTTVLSHSLQKCQRTVSEYVCVICYVTSCRRLRLMWPQGSAVLSVCWVMWSHGQRAHYYTRSRLRMYGIYSQHCLVCVCVWRDCLKQVHDESMTSLHYQDDIISVVSLEVTDCTVWGHVLSDACPVLKISVSQHQC